MRARKEKIKVSSGVCKIWPQTSRAFLHGLAPNLVCFCISRRTPSTSNCVALTYTLYLPWALEILSSKIFDLEYLQSLRTDLHGTQHASASLYMWFLSTCTANRESLSFSSRPLQEKNRCFFRFFFFLASYLPGLQAVHRLETGCKDTSCNGINENSMRKSVIESPRTELAQKTSIDQNTFFRIRKSLCS